jgi:hypothetical protein
MGDSGGPAGVGRTLLSAAFEVDFGFGILQFPWSYIRKGYGMRKSKAKAEDKSVDPTHA